MTILLAEDDFNVRTITQLCLEKMGGHHVTIAIDGAEALAQAKATKFDLLLVDGMMPKLNGVQVARGVRGGINDQTPIIFLSAKAEDADVSEFLKLGSGYIAKPFDPQKICQKIEETLSVCPLVRQAV
jgi:DNA-binding response OmpR family regulator